MGTKRRWEWCVNTSESSSSYTSWSLQVVWWRMKKMLKVYMMEKKAMHHVISLSMTSKVHLLSMMMMLSCSSHEHPIMRKWPIIMDNVSDSFLFPLLIEYVGHRCLYYLEIGALFSLSGRFDDVNAKQSFNLYIYP